MLSLTLIFGVLSPYVATAQETPQTTEEPVTIESEGITYIMNVKETNNEVITTLKSDEGTQTFIRDKDIDYITVSSDYLTENEIKELESSTNEIGDQIKQQIRDENVASLINNLNINSGNNDFSISPMAQKGKWAWSKWSNVTISLAGKTTANAIAVAITSYIPAVGPAAGAFATIIIQNKVKTGYFKRRVATKLDTDPRYHWQKTQVSVYKDKARKKLLKTKTTGSVRKIIHN